MFDLIVHELPWVSGSGGDDGGSMHYSLGISECSLDIINSLPLEYIKKKRS